MKLFGDRIPVLFSTWNGEGWGVGRDDMFLSGGSDSSLFTTSPDA